MLISKKNKVFSNNHCLLCTSVRLVGDLYFSGDFYLEGQLQGNVYVEDGKAAKLIVTETGSIEGEVHVPNVIINGRVQGAIYSSKHLELAAKAWVEGAIYYQTIEVVAGARVAGQMHAMASDLTGNQARLVGGPRFQLSENIAAMDGDTGVAETGNS